MQHFWVTKKTVQRKLGSKEDEHIISSDSELDAKIEIFKSINETTSELSRIIDLYQERLCVLSQEECVFGRFLKEAGKRSKTTALSITNTGKSVTYCGQQRMCVRVPLLRLQHEVNIYRNRAITDTQSTISAMERERTEYRAALEWMKSSSSELDPDTGRGVDKFRTAQSHVRGAKQIFDTLSMDSIQKIDLLAAARCNMFSHVLVSYIAELKNFSQKTSATFDTVSKALDQRPKYDFYILKELTQHEEVHEDIIRISAFNNDQALLFASDYLDTTEKNLPDCQDKASDAVENVPLIELSRDDDILDLCSKDDSIDVGTTLPKNGCNKSQSHGPDIFMFKPKEESILSSSSSTVLATPQSALETLVSRPNSCQQESSSTKNSKQSRWMDLFSDLDPLANLDAFDLKLSGGCTSSQPT